MTTKIAAATLARGPVMGCLFLAGFLVFAQQGNSPEGKPDKSVYAELAKAPAKACARRNPLDGNPDAVATGRKLFAQYCAQCHGAKAEGGKRGPSLVSSEVQQATPGTLFWVLTNGVVRRGMPVWSKLPEPQRWQIVTYLKSLGAATNASSVTKNAHR